MLHILSQKILPTKEQLVVARNISIRLVLIHSDTAPSGYRVLHYSQRHMKFVCINPLHMECKLKV